MNKKIREILKGYKLGEHDRRSGLRFELYDTDQALFVIEQEIKRCMGEDIPSVYDIKTGKKHIEQYNEGYSHRAKNFWEAWRGKK